MWIRDRAITGGVIEAGNDLCVNYTAVLNDKADFYIIGEGKKDVYKRQRLRGCSAQKPQSFQARPCVWQCAC